MTNETRYTGEYIQRELNELDKEIVELNKAIDEVEDYYTAVNLLKTQRSVLIAKRNGLLNTDYVIVR